MVAYLFRTEILSKIGINKTSRRKFTMNNKDDLDDLKGMNAFDMMIYGSLQTQKFSNESLLSLTKMQRDGINVDASYLNLIAAQNVKILELLTFIAKSLKDSHEKEEPLRQDMLNHLRNADYYL